MDMNTARTVREDFMTWSGGCPPDSEQEIFVYMEYVHGSDADDADAVREILRDWMEEQNSADLQD